MPNVQRPAESAGGATGAQAAGVTEVGIGSTDWFDRLFFNTEVTEGYGEHRGRATMGWQATWARPATAAMFQV